MDDTLRLGRLVRARREEMGLSGNQVAFLGGPSSHLLKSIENGRWVSVRPALRTLRRMDRGLLWQDGSAANVLAGGEPTPVDDWETQLPRRLATMPVRRPDPTR